MTEPDYDAIMRDVEARMREALSRPPRIDRIPLQIDDEQEVWAIRTGDSWQATHLQRATGKLSVLPCKVDENGNVTVTLLAPIEAFETEIRFVREPSE